MLRPRLRALALVPLLAVGLIALTGCSFLDQARDIVEDATGTGRDVDDDVVGDDTDAFSIAPGDCVNDATLESEFAQVPIVDCSEPHDSEAYSQFSIEGDAYPGLDAIYAEGDAGCLEDFEPWIGLAFDSSIYNFTYYYPSEDSWTQLGDREIICLAYDPNGQVVGSLAGIAR